MTLYARIILSELNCHNAGCTTQSWAKDNFWRVLSQSELTVLTNTVTVVRMVQSHKKYIRATFIMYM